MLSSYLNIVQYSSDFIHYRDMIHEDGFLIDGSGTCVKDLEDNGGSLIEFRDFLKVVKEIARDISTPDNLYLDKARNRADGRKRKKADPTGGEPAQNRRSLNLLFLRRMRRQS